MESSHHVHLIHVNPLALAGKCTYTPTPTQQKMNNLFWPDENNIEECFAAHIIQGCQQYCSTLLDLIAG